MKANHVFISVHTTGTDYPAILAINLKLPESTEKRKEIYKEDSDSIHYVLKKSLPSGTYESLKMLFVKEYRGE